MAAKGKAPAFQFYPSDWLSDVELQSADVITRGCWINLLCHMWGSRVRGELSGSPEMMARLAGATAPQIEVFLADVEALGFCYVSRKPNGNLTLRNRRMYKAAKDKENNRLRQQRFYEKRATERRQRQPNTDLISPSSSSSSTSLQKKPLTGPKKAAITTDKNPKLQSPKTRAHKTVAPESFPVTTQMLDYAARKKFTGDIAELTDHWLQYHQAKGDTAASWYASWQLWLRNHLKFEARDRAAVAGGPQPRTYAQQQAEQARQQAAECLAGMTEESYDTTAPEAQVIAIEQHLPAKKVN